MPRSVIHTAPPASGEAILGRTLPQLLDDACERFTSPRAFNQPGADGGWTPISLDAFRRSADETALGLHAMGLDRGDPIGFYLESDAHFCIADMGCLIGGFVDVPIYLSSADDVIAYVLDHAGCRAVFVTNGDRLAEIAGLLPQAPRVRHVIVAEPSEEGAVRLPEGVELWSLESVRAEGRARMEADPEAAAALRAAIEPNDLATIIYTSGTTGRPKGVMLTHENISYNALTAYSGLEGYRPGPDGETVLSFLPLTHIFARTLYYGALAYGSPIYFTTPADLVEALQHVRPTTFATVPRVLEKVYARIQEKTLEATGMKRMLGEWALRKAQTYELGQERSGPGFWLADRLVYAKWRAALGGNVRFVIAGGAALHPDLANVFGAAGVPVLQGYGLTETSPVITYNRPGRNRAGTVGLPMPGLEVAIADDGEILTRGPHVMQGYYREPEKTAEVLDADGWFHTGDIGTFTDEGYLKITDRKKSLFKLSTGKYVMPQPLEIRLGSEALIEHGIVVGSGRKYCAALLFPDEDALRAWARSQGVPADGPIAALLREPQVVARYEALVDRANEGMEPWSTIKRFVLVPDHLTVENEMLTPTLKVKRPKVRERFAKHIEALYDETKREALEDGVVVR
ncbi:MAG: long-chain fatty acid--CoA ligase [Rhodothermales bacterium]|nr:long-chain fatty acid--CoA ligase [Rhodothermales bacterium]